MSALPVITTLKHANQGLVSPLVRLAHHQTDETGNLLATGGTNPLPVSGSVTVAGTTYNGTATITRAANATPYTIGDVVGGAFTLATAGPVSADVLLIGLTLLYNVSALPSGLQNFTAHFYNVTPPSAIADNSPFTLGSGDRAAYLGRIDNIPISAVGVGTQTVVGQLDNFIKKLACDSSGQIFGYLVTNQAFTPAGNSETISLRSDGLKP